MAIKLFFDEIDYFQSLHDIYRGLRKFTHVCKLVGIIKPLAFGDEKFNYESRFRPFEFIQIPRYNSYEMYQKSIEMEEHGEGDVFDRLLLEAKAFL